MAGKKSVLPALEKYYQFFTSGSHAINPDSVQLARYFDSSDEPAPEVLTGEVDSNNKTHYDKVCDFFRDNYFTLTETEFGYNVKDFYDYETNTLTSLFYRGDRTMRESGFDISNRFGYFNADIINYYPVCLNSLLYIMEKDMVYILETILHRSGPEVDKWKMRSEQRKRLIQEFMWDEQEGLYYDYNFKTGKRRIYDFATTFYPLYAGICTQEQANRIVQNLHKFESVGGIVTSGYVTKCQWDKPFGWAPLQLICVHGLRQYGFQEEAVRISKKFITLITRYFQRTKTIVEKYNVCDLKQGPIENNLEFGYIDNPIGFGWTNAVFNELLFDLKIN